MKEEFYLAIEKYLPGMLPAKYAGYSIEMKDIVKEGGNYKGLIIKESDKNFAPVINLDAIYDSIEKEDLLEMISATAKQVVDIYESKDDIEDNIEDIAMQVLDFDKIKENIYISAVSFQYRKDVDLTLCHMEEDIPVQTRIHLLQPESENYITSIEIKQNLLDYWEKDIEEVYEIAKTNMKRLFPAQIKEIGEILGMDFDSNLLVVTNEKNNHGAAEIFLPEVAKEVAEKVGRKYYVIPSSVHEVLILPATEGYNKEEITSINMMVKEVNENNVLPTEVLSEKVYCFDAATNEIVDAEKYIEQEEKEKDNEKEQLVIPKEKQL